MTVVKGKTAVDVIGGRLGKATGEYIQNAIYIITGTKDVITVAPYFSLIPQAHCTMEFHLR